MENNQKAEALELFRQIKSPDKYHYATIFKLCAELGDQQSLKFGKHLFKTMPKTFRNTIVSSSALILFNKCEDIAQSEEIFSKMEKNLFSYSIMMKGLFRNRFGLFEKSLFFFKDISQIECLRKQSIFSLKSKVLIEFVIPYSSMLVLN